MAKLRFFILFCLLTFSFSLSFADSKPHPESRENVSDEEAFLIRRIAEFWKDGDFEIVKTQITQFFAKYPKSSLKDYLEGILGDIYLQEKNYKAALMHYKAIEDPDLIKKVLLNKFQCYYELDLYDELSQEGMIWSQKETLPFEDRLEEFYFLTAESYFRKALLEKDPALRTSLAREAKSFYNHLSAEGSYADISSFALAEIHAMLQEYEEGAKAYLALSQKHESMKEELLFQAASLQAQFDQKKALETFREIQTLEGEKTQDAAYNSMVLLFEMQAYDDILSSYESIAPSIPEENKPLFLFIVGKSFFAKEDYAHAIEPLSQYIELEYVPSEELKNSLLILMTCAHKTNHEELFTKAYDKLDTLFPNDPQVPKALFIHAMILKENGEMAKADAKLRQIKESYPDFEEKGVFLFECGFLAHQNQRWEESYHAFETFIQKYPENAYIEEVWKLFISSSLNLYHQKESYKLDKGLFFTHLQEAKHHLKAFSPEEKKAFNLLFAQIAFENEAFDTAIHTLQDTLFIQMEEEDAAFNLSKAHYIAGLCHEKLESYSAFCMHLEQALLLNPKEYDTPQVHVQLFNGYICLGGYGDSLQQIEKNDLSLSKEALSHAASHLQEAIDKGIEEIKQENRLWIANYYFENVRKYLEAHWTHAPSDQPEILNSLNRSMAHYKHLLLPDTEHPIQLNTSTLYLEQEFLKFAKLMKYRGENKKRLALIKSLLEQQIQSSDLSWACRMTALFELANTYLDLNELEKAYETFSFIRTSPFDCPIEMMNEVILKSTRLRFALLEKNAKNESNPEVLAILNDLKELQIRKNVDSEPIHLEAALDYAKIRFEICDQKDKNSRYLFFLKRIQEDFTSKENIVTQDYLEKLDNNTHKKHLFDAYMKFVDAEIERLQANQLHEKQLFHEMEEQSELALSLYSEIKNDPAIPKDLYDKISHSIEEINALNAY